MDNRQVGVAVRSSAFLGVACPSVSLFFASLTSLFRPDLDPFQRYVSELARGPHGGLLTLSLLVYALGLLALAVTLQALLGAAPAARTGFHCLVIGAAGIFLGALFPTDLLHGPHTLHGNVHNFSVLAAFIALNFGFLAWARAFRADPAWHRFAVHAHASAVINVCAFVGFAAVTGFTWLTPSDFPNRFVGASERLVLICNMAWIFATALELFLRVQPQQSRREVPRPLAADPIGF